MGMKILGKKWKSWLIFVVVPVTVTLCLLLIGYGVYLNKRSGKQYFEKGRIYASSDRHIEAIREFKKALIRKPDDEYIHYNLGSSYIKINEYDSAKDEFEAVLEINPDLYEASIQQAVINFLIAKELKKLGKRKSLINEKFVEAENICKDVIEKKSNLTRAHMVLAEIHLAQGLIGDAIKNYEDALQIDNSLKNVHFALARLFQQEGQFDLAVKQCNLILSEPAETESDYYYKTQIFLSNIYVEQGDIEKAIECLNDVLDKRPDDVIAHTKLAMFYLQISRYDKAQPEVQIVERLSSSLSRPGLSYFVKGCLLIHEKDYINAIRPLTKATVKLPNVMQAHFNLAIALKECGRIEQAKTEFYTAIEQCKSMLKIEPENVEALQIVGTSYMNIQDYENAEKLLRKAISISPGDANTRLNLGMLLESQKLFKESISEYEKVIELEPSSPIAYNNLAWIYVKNKYGTLKDALELAEKAKELAPDNASVVDTLGWIYYLNGMYDKALPELETAVKTAPGNATLHYHLGMIYFKKGLTELSLSEMERAIEISSAFPEANDAQALIEKMKSPQ